MKAEGYFSKLQRQSSAYQNHKAKRQFLRVVGFNFNEINAINNKTL